MFNTPPPPPGLVRGFSLLFSQSFSFNLICLPLPPSGAHWSAPPGVCIHHSSPKAPSVRPPPCWVSSFFLQTQQDERLLERRLLHKLRVHVLLERVQSWKKTIRAAERGCGGRTNTRTYMHYLVVLCQTAAWPGRQEAGTPICLNRLCRSARIPEEAGKKS